MPAPSEDEEHREQDDRQREQHVHHAHRDAVDGPAPVAGDEADQRAERRGGDAGRERDDQQRPAADEVAGEEVVAELVRAERMAVRPIPSRGAAVVALALVGSSDGPTVTARTYRPRMAMPATASGRLSTRRQAPGGATTWTGGGAPTGAAAVTGAAVELISCYEPPGPDVRRPSSCP